MELKTELATDATPTVASTQPVSDKQRIESLDLLRGLSILGILLMNIVGFGYFMQGPGVLEKLLTETNSPNFWAYAFTTVFFEGKMRALFCMLFGAGIMLFSIQKLGSGKKNMILLFYLRMIWLTLFGLMHAHLLLWMGDILYFYGIFGMLVFLMRNMKPNYKAMALPIVILIGFVLSTILYQGFRAQRLAYVKVEPLLATEQTLTEEQQKAVDDWREVEKMFLPNAEDAQKSIDNMRGSYSQVASEVRPKAWEFQTTLLLFLLGDNVALMLLGMALMQWGFFSGKWTDRQYRLAVIIGYGVGLPLATFELWYGATYNATLEQILSNLENQSISWMGLVYQVQRIFLVMAHAALILLLFKAGWLDTFKRSLKAVGQMAFTNYILQTVLSTLFFFGYGLGYYNYLEFYQLFFVMAGIWVVSLVISPIWLKYFKYGPLEWLWRSLSYRKIQPMLR